jgi:hypothetical protein
LASFDGGVPAGEYLAVAIGESLSPQSAWVDSKLICFESSVENRAVEITSATCSSAKGRVTSPTTKVVSVTIIQRDGSKYNGSVTNKTDGTWTATYATAKKLSSLTAVGDDGSSDSLQCC